VLKSSTDAIGLRQAGLQSGKSAQHRGFEVRPTDREGNGAKKDPDQEDPGAWQRHRGRETRAEGKNVQRALICQQEQCPLETEESTPSLHLALPGRFL
jgi:hypothetical protein